MVQVGVRQSVLVLCTISLLFSNLALAQAASEAAKNEQAKASTVSAENLNSESVLPLEEVTEPKTSPSWTYSFFSIGGLTPGQVDRGSGSYSAYNYISFNYKLSDKTKFSIRPVFYANTAGFDKSNNYQEQSVKLGDLHLVYSVNDYLVAGRIKMSTALKLYLPTSEFSKASKMIAQFRPETYIQYELNRFDSVSWVLKPDIYLQSQTAYLDSATPQYDDGFYKFDPRKTTRIAALEHYLEYAKSFGKEYTLKPALGFKEDWTYGSEVEKLEGSHSTSFRSAIGLDIKLIKNWTITPGVENIVKVSNPKGDVKFYRPDDNNYTLMVSGAL